jgi:hypothetical protein
MARNINSLLNKKGWTGAEVGKALVKSIVHDIKHRDEPDFKPLFSQSDFDKMESSIKTEREYLTYGVYRDIYSGLIDAFNSGQAQYQQFYNGYYRYAMYLQDALKADYMLQQAELLPYVMTEKQYNKLKEQTETELKGNTESFSTLFFDILSDMAKSPENAPEAIRDAIEATKKEAVTNKRILSNYNEIWDRGYYQLPDGTRSDQVTSEEWEKRYKANYLKNHKVYINGELASWEDTIFQQSIQLQLAGNKLFFEGIDTIREIYKEKTGEELPQEHEAELLEILENLEEYRRKALIHFDNGFSPKLSNSTWFNDELLFNTEWNYYTETPKDLTKYNIILESPSYFYKDDNGNLLLTEFKADYPALYKAMEAYIKELIPQARSLKPSRYNKDFITWGELAELNLQGYSDLIEADNNSIADFIAEKEENTTENLLKCIRIRKNGINIAQNPMYYQENESGDFIDNTLNAFSLITSESIDSIAQKETLRKDIIGFGEKLFKPALRYIYAFNALVKILGAVYDIAELGEVELKTAQFEEQLDALNSTLYMFYVKVYGTPAEKNRKRELIKEIFYPVNYEELKPTEEAIEELTGELDKLGFNTESRKKLKDFDSLINRLCERGL